MPEYLDQKYLNYEHSFKEFKSLLTTEYTLDSYPPKQAQDQTFGIEFPGALIRKPIYRNCTFIESQFNSSDGALSKFYNCQFVNCFFNNCDFRYCDIFSSNFCSSNKNHKILSCNFSFGNFINSAFTDIEFNGCSFRQMQIENTTFKNCIMQHSSIEQSNIKNCVFEKMDLRKVGVRYCTFDKVIFNNVTFHILDLARNYGLIQILQQNAINVKVAYGNEEEMSLNAALPKLKELIPYYFETQQFYEILNVYIAFNEQEKILEILPFAFESVITACDFAALQDLCSLIVKFNICSDKQLRDFYVMIKQLIVPDNFPHYLRKSYNLYIENIKHILVDNPYDNPQAQILLKTDIESLSDLDMYKLLKTIEVTIHEIAPNVDTSIQLTHHSPYDVIIALCGMLPEILTVCQIFYYSLGGTKSLSDLKNSLKEKTDNRVVNNKPGTVEEDVNSIKHLEVSFGKFFSFKLDKQYTKRVKSMEYTIH
ncbi:MAG: pentapeptide repeat-containing protein [Lachnospiraceae bacterium]|nr:pentapeptide repeat-containing protein [Lachnospiraceae bacterium]